MKLHNKSKMVNRSKHWVPFSVFRQFFDDFFFNDVYFHEIFCIYLFTCEKGRGIAGFQDQQNANCQSGPLHLQKIEKNQEMKMFLDLVKYILVHAYIFLLLFGKKVPNFNQAEKMPLYTPSIIKIMIYVFFSSEFVIQ